ncbi:MAG: hypothetical protein H6708_23685 [Kofleriaceae bacterium]|nr:hypothetical protein [Myxococcales bacterium]MCB9563413.1 hypothetical protein [Kofleriaceae bacterium]
MVRTRLAILTLASLAGVAAATSAATDAAAGKGRKLQQVKFVGIHPIPKAEGGGVCHIEVPHVHIYAPADAKVQYRVHEGEYFFVGDPVAYGWEGPKYAYNGHHPIHVDVVVDDDDPQVEYCYLDGPHYHAYAPPEGASFELQGGAYWFVGEPPQAYLDGRAELDPIDVVYQPISYERPTVVVEAPPPAWIGLHVHAEVPAVVVEEPVVHARGHVHAGVEVVAPSLTVEVGVPVVEIGIGGHVGGAVIIHDEHHHHGKYKVKGKRKGHGKRGRGRW